MEALPAARPFAGGDYVFILEAFGPRLAYMCGGRRVITPHTAWVRAARKRRRRRRCRCCCREMMLLLLLALRDGGAAQRAKALTSLWAPQVGLRAVHDPEAHLARGLRPGAGLLIAHGIGIIDSQHMICWSRARHMLMLIVARGPRPGLLIDENIPDLPQPQ